MKMMWKRLLKMWTWVPQGGAVEALLWQRSAIFE
jgi:hypothetical protein